MEYIFLCQSILFYTEINLIVRSKIVYIILIIHRIYPFNLSFNKINKPNSELNDIIVLLGSVIHQILLRNNVF